MAEFKAGESCDLTGQLVMPVLHGRATLTLEWRLPLTKTQWSRMCEALSRLADVLAVESGEKAPAQPQDPQPQTGGEAG